MTAEIVSRVIRNHALEHATMNVLSEKHTKFSAQGNSTPWGFHLNIYGPVTDEVVAGAVDEAYTRLQQGERKLALHPNCGTVLLTSATMATLAAQSTFSLERRRQQNSTITLGVLLNALPAAILAVVVALIISRPVGMAIQERFTVDPELGGLQVVQVKRVSPSPITRLFQLLLGQSKNQDVNAFKVLTQG
jgi:hypothetical protein